MEVDTTRFAYDNLHMTPHGASFSLWDRMAGEILYKVFTLLGASESYNCSLVCRLWREMQNDPVLWKSFYFDTFFKVEKRSILSINLPEKLTHI